MMILTIYTYIRNLIECNNIITVDITPKKNAIVTACDSKYFKSCLTLIKMLFMLMLFMFLI